MSNKNKYLISDYSENRSVSLLKKKYAECCYKSDIEITDQSSSKLTTKKAFSELRLWLRGSSKITSQQSELRYFY